MTNINKVITMGLLAALPIVAAIGIATSTGAQVAHAQTARASQVAEGVVAANVNVQAQNILNNNDVTVCIISADQSCR